MKYVKPNQVSHLSDDEIEKLIKDYYDGVKIKDIIEIYKIEGKSKINESVLKKYKTYLDWITLVYLADKEKAKEYIDIEIHKKKDLLKQFEKKSDKSEEKDIFKELDSRAKNVKKEDLEEFKRIYNMDLICTYVLSPVYGQIEPKELVQFVKDNMFENTMVQVQLHKIIWNPDERGV